MLEGHVEFPGSQLAFHGQPGALVISAYAPLLNFQSRNSPEVANNSPLKASRFVSSLSLAEKASKVFLASYLRQ